MADNSFFAMLFRMKFINRWGLMRNTVPENLSEHSLEVGIISYALCAISNTRYGTALNCDRAAVIGMFHDCPEIITGDLPTPIKYFSPEIKGAYDKVEEVACERLLSLLPEDLRPAFSDAVFERDEELVPFVKAADKIAALIKCIEETKMGNSEFEKAEKSARKIIADMKIAAADDFVKEFVPSFALTLDEQSGDNND